MNERVDDQLHDYFRSAMPTAFPPCPVVSAPVESANRNRSTWVAAMMTLAAILLLGLAISVTPSSHPKNEPVYDPFQTATANGKALKLHTPSVVMKPE